MMQLMRYEDFKKELLSGIKSSLPEEYKDYSVEMYRIKKLNQCLDGICMLDKSAEKAVSPVIYADEMYGEYIKNGDLYGTVKAAADLLVGHFSGTQGVCLENLEENIVTVLVIYEQNREMLENVLHIPYREFAIVFRWIMKRDEKGVLGCLVTNEMAKALKLDVDSLYVKSLENMKRLLPMTLDPLTDMLKLPENAGIPVYVLSNKYGIEGSAYILHHEIMRAIQTDLKSPFYILLPCIREALIIPKECCSAEEMEKALEKIIDDMHNKSEVLCNKVYLFDNDLK